MIDVILISILAIIGMASVAAVAAVAVYFTKPCNSSKHSYKRIDDSTHIKEVTIITTKEDDTDISSLW